MRFRSLFVFGLGFMVGNEVEEYRGSCEVMIPNGKPIFQTAGARFVGQYGFMK